MRKGNKVTMRMEETLCMEYKAGHRAGGISPMSQEVDIKGRKNEYL
jgi:hypothetical protein